MIKRLGLIVNPVAGLGGRVGLKGSDSLEIQQQARALGAQPQSGERAAQALEALKRNLCLQGSAGDTIRPADFEIFAAPGEMGETIARQCAFEPQVVGAIHSGATSAEDTRRIAQEMGELGVGLMLFAGGDGTARDLCQALGGGQRTSGRQRTSGGQRTFAEMACLGIPAGVKIHSAVFAIQPRAAGELAAAWLRQEKPRLREAEVVDLDEESYRQGQVATRLYGYLRVPYRPLLVQNQKVPTPAAEAAQADAIAAAIVEAMPPGWLYILGPGTTTRAIARRLGVEKTLVGVDVVTRDGLAATDVSEERLLDMITSHPARIVVSPIGGQGFLFGRGNQPISPAVLHAVGKENLLVACLPDKLNALRGRPFLVDSGDAEVDAWLAGYVQVITGYRDRVYYRIAGET
jgi:predicted polyphosphate/ATP-dependent NAD kinase